jgi:BirA family biotin operon repressor/biotin-[acetyl-CoA-carboxylase] ligase
VNRKASSWEGKSLDELRQRWDRPHVHLFARVDSSNACAAQLAAHGAAAGTLVLADEQTAGRGSGGRSWHSPRGVGLYLSLVLRPKSLPNPHLMPLLAGLGAALAVERLIDGGGVAIKWPNDIIIRDRKVGGVLSEASWSGERLNHVVLGIGLNVHQKSGDFPDPLRDVATSLDLAAGWTVSRLALADEVIRETEARCVRPPSSLGRDDLRRLDDYDWLRDRRCCVAEAGRDPIWGVAAGIAPDGGLLFRPDGGALRRIVAGHVTVNELPTPDF